jgi:hypothetical protein
MCSPDLPDPVKTIPPSDPPPSLILDAAGQQRRKTRRSVRASRRGRSGLRIDLGLGSPPSESSVATAP